jgi:flagellar biosynthesis protein FlhB
MSDEAGEKTEQPTAKKLEEALKNGQIPRSAEIQTVCVVFAGMWAVRKYGAELWQNLHLVFEGVLGHLHDIRLDFDALPDLAIKSALMIVTCVTPVVVATGAAGLITGALQNKFNVSSERLSPNWGRLNPMDGLKRIFSPSAAVPALLNLLKLGFIGFFSWSLVRSILDDPIFHTAVDTARIATFLAETGASLAGRMLGCLLVIAVCDYAYQVRKIGKDLMMTKEQVKDEAKQSDSNPQVKSEMRKRRLKMKSFRAQLADIPKADVVVTNPTHIAVALLYDRETMAAPKIIAKARGFNAGRIREAAKAAQIPIVENKPLARMLFKYGRVEGEVPVQLYAAIAEILAYVYRINRYRYHVQGRALGGRR